MNTLLHSLRWMSRSPGFTGVAVLTLAVGIGANTAVFSIFKAVVLEPFPYPQPHELVHLWQTDIGGRGKGPLSGPDFFDLRDGNRTFEDLGVYCPLEFNLGVDQPDRIPGALCSAGLLRTLGVPPAAGRLFSEAEEADGSRPVILSHALWEKHFDRDPGLVGQAILLNGTPHSVVGIMPASFEFFSPWSPSQTCMLWTPFPLQGGPGQLAPREDLRPSRWMLAVGRLKPGITLQEVQSDLQTLSQRMAEAHPESNARVRIWAMPFSWAIVGDSLGRVFILLATVGFILLVACANVTTMLLARSSGRSNEMAVRVALGASRRRIVRQLLGESAILVALGAGVGIVSAYWVLGSVGDLLPINLPRGRDVAIDHWVLWFTLGVSAVAVLLSGLAPALVSARTSVVGVLKQQSGLQCVSRTRSRILKLLLTLQIALALLTTNQATLLFGSLRHALNSERVFDTDQVLTASLNLSGGEYVEPSRRVAFWNQLIEKVGAAPGVDCAAVATQLPLASGGYTTYRFPDEDWRSDAARRWAFHTYVSPDFFRAMGIDLLRGRALRNGDDLLPVQGVVVNSALADLCWPEENPLGRQIVEDRPEPGWRAVVVGVVESPRQHGLARNAQPEIYWLYAVNPWEGSSLVVRCDTQPAALVPAIRASVAELDPYLPLSHVATMREIVVESLQGRSSITLLVSLMALLILLLAMIGVYGMISHVVAQRTHEFGLRMALGASRRHVLISVVWQTVRWSLLGVAVGLLLSFNAAFLSRHLVFGVGTPDLLALAVGCGLVLVATVCSACLPALRAASSDPMAALRCE